MRLRKHTRKLGAFQAWNKCLNHLLELARAHVEAVMLTNMLDGANKCEDLDARKSIKVRHQFVQLCYLYNVPAVQELYQGVSHSQFEDSWALRACVHASDCTVLAVHSTRSEMLFSARHCWSSFTVGSQ